MHALNGQSSRMQLTQKAMLVQGSSLLSHDTKGEPEEASSQIGSCREECQQAGLAELNQ